MITACERLERWIRGSSHVESHNAGDAVASYQRAIATVVGALEDIQCARPDDAWLQRELDHVLAILEEVQT